MAMSTDSDLSALQPDILSFGISDFTAEHAKAQADIERYLRGNWWNRTGRSGEMDATLLTDSQFTRAAAYRVLSNYALPQLTKWKDENDRFQLMIEWYQARYKEELEAILMDGVEYDADEDSTVENGEKKPLHTRRLVR